MRIEANMRKSSNCVLGKYESLIAAVVFPILICCIGFALIGVYPFGARSALIIDGVHQYLGFYKELYSQITKGGNWMFSQCGMGHDFYGIFSYYLSSPFSLLILFLMNFIYVNEAVTIVVLIKIGLASFCMTWYIQKKTKGENVIALCIGCAYGLSNYMLGYYSNIMWLDCIMLLPILAWSIEKLIYTGRWKMYTIVLAYCILSNYYFGFMLCVFSVLYYLAVYLGTDWNKVREINRKIKEKISKQLNKQTSRGIEGKINRQTSRRIEGKVNRQASRRIEEKTNRRTNKELNKQINEKTNGQPNKKIDKKVNGTRDSWKKASLKFIGASLLSGGIVAIILIPALFTIAETAAAGQTNISLNMNTYGNIWVQLKELLFDSWAYATSADQGSVNIYCGCAILLFGSLYFFNRRIGWRKKVAMAGLIVFYFAGFHFVVLNFFLHGLHTPAGMPNRFSFIVIFLLLSIGGQGWKKAEYIDKGFLISALAIVLLFCSVISIKTGDMQAAKSVVLLLIYFLFLMGANVFHREKITKMLCHALIAVVFLGEIGTHGILSIRHTGSAHRDLYEQSEKELQRFMNTKADRNWYRTDLVNPILRNEELLYNLNGVAMFSSTNAQNMQNFMGRMGFETSKNRFQYNGGTEVMDMLLGIKYLACRKNINFNTAYKKVNSGAYFDFYKNSRAMANAYLVDYKMKNFKLRGGNPMEVQNNLLEQMGCGMAFQLNIAEPMKYSFEVDGSAYEIKLKGGEHGYLWLSGQEPSVVDAAGRIQDSRSWNNNFIDLGYSQKDRTVRVDVPNNPRLAILGTLNEKRMDTVYKKLQKNEVWLQNGQGKISTTQNKVLYIPMFYNKGLQVQIDGQNKKVLNLGGMTGVLIPKGNHDIKIAYETRGFWPGAAISIVSIFICAGASCMESYQGSKKRVKNRKRHETKILVYLE